MGFFVRRGDAESAGTACRHDPARRLRRLALLLPRPRLREGGQSGKAVPSFAGRILPVRRIRKLSKVLEKRGQRIVVIGRLASFPSTLLGAAAGASEVPSRTFLPADFLGAMLSIVEVVGAGYLLGEAYDEAGLWITGIGVVALLGLLIGVGQLVARE